MNVNLGPGSCEKERLTLISRDKGGEAYLVILSVNGPVEAPIVSSNVTLTTSEEIVESFLSTAPLPFPAEHPAREPRPAQAPKRKQNPVVQGAWSEIASGSWPDAESYRVLVRIVRS